MAGARGRLCLPELFRRCAPGLGRSVHLRRPSLAPVSGAGSAGDSGADGGLVPFHFSDRLLFAHRLHGELVPRPRAGVLAGGTEASLGDSGCARADRHREPAPQGRGGGLRGWAAGGRLTRGGPAVTVRLAA